MFRVTKNQLLRRLLHLTSVVLFLFVSSCESSQEVVPDVIISCTVEDPVTIRFATFSTEVLPIEEGEDLPVWFPPQGGIVTGYNLLITGFPLRARSIFTVIKDDQGNVLVDEQANKVKLPCQGDGVRMLIQYMPAFHWTAKMEDLANLDVTVEIEAVFEDDDGELHSHFATHSGTLIEMNIIF